MTCLSPLFWCAACHRRIDTVRGIVICQGTVYCGDTCHENNHRHEEHDHEPSTLA